MDRQLTYTATLHRHLVEMAKDEATKLFTDNPGDISVEVVDPWDDASLITQDQPPAWPIVPHILIRLILNRAVSIQYVIDTQPDFWLNAHDDWRRHRMADEIKHGFIAAIKSHYLKDTRHDNL